MSDGNLEGVPLHPDEVIENGRLPGYDAYWACQYPERRAGGGDQPFFDQRCPRCVLAAEMLRLVKESTGRKGVSYGHDREAGTSEVIDLDIGAWIEEAERRQSEEDPT